MVPTTVTRQHHGVRITFRDEAATMGRLSAVAFACTFVAGFGCPTAAVLPLVSVAAWTSALFAAAWAFLPTYQRIDIDHETFRYTTGTRLGRRHVRTIPLKQLWCYPVHFDGPQHTPFATFVLPTGEQVAVPTASRAEAELLIELVDLAQSVASAPREQGSAADVPPTLRGLRREPE